MTGRKVVHLHAQLMFDRFMWGLGDLKRAFIAHGWWPTKNHVGVSGDGGCWTIIGSSGERCSAGSRPTCLAILESDCLWGQTQLPQMHRQFLDAAVQEALWRQSPLPPGQIVSAWQCEPSPAGGWVVDWGLCRRSLQDDMRSRFNLDGQSLTFLLRHGRALVVRDAASQRRDRRQRMTDWGVSVMLIVTVLAVSTLALMPVVLKRQAVVEAMLQVTALEPKASPLRRQLEALRRQTTVSTELRRSVEAVVPAASVVEALTAALPDDSWLDRMDINGDEIRISGMTPNANALIALIGRNAALADVRATAPNVRDTALNKERFAFEMHWHGEVRP